MSLSCLAMRTCVFMALYGKTIAEGRVYDSSLLDIDDLSRADPQPFITIYVDDAQSEGPGGKPLLNRLDRVSLVIELAMSTPGSIDTETGTLTVPPTDMGLEWGLDILAHQVMRLLATDAPWGDLFRRFIVDIKDVRFVRGGTKDKGERIAARQIVISVDPVDAPVDFVLDADDGPWIDFLASLRAVDENDPVLGGMTDLADMVEAAIRYPTTLVDWQKSMASLGVAAEGASMLGFGPVAEITTPETPVIETINIEDTVVDQDFIDGAGP